MPIVSLTFLGYTLLAHFGPRRTSYPQSRNASTKSSSMADRSTREISILCVAHLCCCLPSYPYCPTGWTNCPSLITRMHGMDAVHVDARVNSFLTSVSTCAVSNHFLEERWCVCGRRWEHSWRPGHCHGAPERMSWASWNGTDRRCISPWPLTHVSLAQGSHGHGRNRGGRRWRTGRERVAFGRRRWLGLPSSSPLVDFVDFFHGLLVNGISQYVVFLHIDLFTIKWYIVHLQN